MKETLAFRAKDSERETAWAPSYRLPQRDLPFASLAEGRTIASRPVPRVQLQEYDAFEQVSRAPPTLWVISSNRPPRALRPFKHFAGHRVTEKGHAVDVCPLVAPTAIISSCRGKLPDDG